MDEGHPGLDQFTIFDDRKPPQMDVSEDNNTENYKIEDKKECLPVEKKLCYEKPRSRVGTNSERRTSSGHIFAQRSFSNDNELPHKALPPMIVKKEVPPDADTTTRIPFANVLPETTHQREVVPGDKPNNYGKENRITTAEKEMLSQEKPNSGTSQSKDHKSYPDQRLLNSPQHYWDLLFESQEICIDIPHKIFFMLLFDYQQLWRERHSSEKHSETPQSR